jgi:hypothetical protein
LELNELLPHSDLQRSQEVGCKPCALAYQRYQYVSKNLQSATSVAARSAVASISPDVIEVAK